MNPRSNVPVSDDRRGYSKFAVGSAAALGGIAPNLLRLAVRLTGDEQSKIGLSAGYFVGLVLFAVLGYVMAMIWNERVPRRALYLGIGLPALLQAGITAHSKPEATAFLDRQPAGIFSAFSTSAYAQPSSVMRMTPPAPTIATLTTGAGNTRKLQVNFSDVPSDTRVVFVNAAGKTLGVAPDWKHATNGSVNIPIPHDATQVRLLSSFARNTPTISLQPAGDQSIRLGMKTDFTAGFLKALGVDAADTLEIKPVQKR